MKGFPAKDRHTPLQRTSELHHLSEVCCLSGNSVLPTFLYFSTKECPRLYRYCYLSACYTLFLHLVMLLEKNAHIVTGNEESGFFFASLIFCLYNGNGDASCSLPKCLSGSLQESMKVSITVNDE